MVHTIKRWFVPLIFAGTLGSIVLFAYLLFFPGSRFYLQELCSVILGKGKARGEARFQQRLDILGKTRDILALKMLVKKTSRVLILSDRDQVLATFPIGLGRDPIGQKVRAEDGKTPEGEYFVCYKKEDSRYHLFLGLSYPSPEDASRGLDAGIITATEAEAILDAGMAKSRPPWNTALGGPFGIHGYGSDLDWTEGTIAMANSNIEEIFWNVPIGTSVTVQP